MLNAAALVASDLFDSGDAQEAPEFTVLRFYKILGFLDLEFQSYRKTQPACSGRGITLAMGRSVFCSLSLSIPLDQGPNEDCFKVYPPKGRGSEYVSLSVNYSGIYCGLN